MTIGIVGGSDLTKITEQLGSNCEFWLRGRGSRVCLLVWAYGRASVLSLHQMFVNSHNVSQHALLVDGALRGLLELISTGQFPISISLEQFAVSVQMEVSTLELFDCKSVSVFQ